MASLEEVTGWKRPVSDSNFLTDGDNEQVHLPGQQVNWQDVPASKRFKGSTAQGTSSPQNQQENMAVNLLQFAKSSSSSATAKDKLRSEVTALYSHALPSTTTASPISPVISQLTPLFTQFLAWQRLVQIHYEIEQLEKQELLLESESNAQQEKKNDVVSNNPEGEKEERGESLLDKTDRTDTSMDSTVAGLPEKIFDSPTLTQQKSRSPSPSLLDTIENSIDVENEDDDEFVPPTNSKAGVARAGAKKRKTDDNNNNAGPPKVQIRELKNNNILFDKRQGTIVLGRTKHYTNGVDVDLTHADNERQTTISRKHAEITWDPKAKNFKILNMGRNGTRVDGKSLADNRRGTLRNGSLLTMGKELQLIFSYTTD